MKERLAEVGRRLQRLAGHGAGEPRLWERVGAELFPWLYQEPRVSSDALARLVGALETSQTGDALFASAVRELERGVRAVERSTRALGRLPMAQLSWLWRMHQIVRRAEQLMESPDRWQRRALAARAAPHRLAPPPVSGTAGAVAVDPLIDAANHEFRRLGRKRRLLEAARQLLLDAGAAGQVDPDAARARRIEIARQIARLDRLQAAGLSPEIDLVHQAQQARAHGDLQRLAAALTALEEGALAAGQDGLGRVAEKALDKMWGVTPRLGNAAAAAASLAQSQRQMFGQRAHESIRAGYKKALKSLPALREKWKDQLDAAFFDDVARYLGRQGVDATGATLAAAGAADGCFELGDPVSPVRSLEVTQRLTQVRHPTQDMTLVPAQTVGDLPNAVIQDPRTVLASFASGTLLTRRYLAVETEAREKKGWRNDARFYLLDGSGSMLGPRARMRDALLVTELLTLAARLEDPGRAGRPVLYYCYFDEEVGPVHRVDTVEEAYQAIEEIISTVRLGGTNIEHALLTGFDHLRKARQEDPDLVRAQLVLVTDGEASIDIGAVESARAAVGELPLGVSMVALGQENRALRELAARQRQRRDPVFYQFMDDAELAELAGGAAPGVPIHLPASGGLRVVTAELSALLQEMDQCARGLDAVSIEQATVLEPALKEVGLSLAEGLTETARARHEALIKDQATLDTRFRRWFPPPPEVAPPPRPPTDEQRARLGEAAQCLAAVAEVIAIGTTGALERRADAIEIMERLLREVGMPPWDYADLLRRFPMALAGPLCAVRVAAGQVAP